MRSGYANKQDVKSELMAMLTELTEEFGQEELGRRVTEYADRLERISQLNQDLSTCCPENRKAEYDRIVQDIMSATREYYAHVANLPEKLRRFLTTASDIGGIGEEISALLGTQARLEPPPLVSRAIRPENYIMQIDAITNQLANLGAHNQITVGRHGKRPVTTTVALDMPDHMRIEGGHALSTYDKSIINGVTSLLESGNTVFSIPMLYHAMTGRQNPSVDSQLYEELSGKLEKMRRMILTIDLSEENGANYLTGPDGNRLTVDQLSIEGYLLPLNRARGVINGKRAELYQIIQPPPLYLYSKMKRQLASVRITLLDAPVNNSSTTIPLKTYLLQRIEMMKNRKNNIVSNTILYKSVYQELGAEDAGKTRKMRIRSYTASILDYFAAQKYIRGYVVLKKGNSITGVNIEL